MIVLAFFSLLIIFAVLLFYFSLYVASIVVPMRFVTKNNLSIHKKRCFAVAIFIIMTAIFWGKNIASYATYQYQCASKQQLNIYKTLAQWKKENPNVWQTLQEEKFYRYSDPSLYPNLALEKQFNGKNYKIGSGGNQRIIVYTRDEYSFGKQILENSHIVFDTKTQEILADYTDFRWISTWHTFLRGMGTGNEDTATCYSNISQYIGYINSFSNPE